MIEKIGINDSFFGIGGDSIKALRLLSLMSTHELKVEMKDLFRYPTIAQLAKHAGTNPGR